MNPTLYLSPALRALKLVPPWLIAAGVLVGGLAITGVAGLYSQESGHAAAQARFDGAVAQAIQAVERRMMNQEQLLRGGAALFNLNGTVSREQWRAYVGGIKLDETYPGLLGVGYTQRIPAGEMNAHVRAIRSEGYPEYAIRPDSPVREEYFSIIYLEPFWGRNLKAFGYDMFTEPTRRQAMERARDSGEVALSGMVTLVQEAKRDVQPGFLVYMPVYRRGLPRATVSERRDALQGFVYTPVRARDFLSNVLESSIRDVAIEIYDGETADPARLLYQSQRIDGNGGSLRTVHQLPLAGQIWTLRIATLPAFDAAFAHGQTSMVAAIGAILSSLLAYLVFNLTTNRNRAYDMARSMTSQLRDSESRLRSVLSSAADGILTIDASGTVESANPAALHIFGHSSETMRGALLKDLIDGHDADHLEHIVLTQGNAVTGSTRFEALARRAGGESFPVDVSLGITTSDGQRCYTLMVRDITDAKMAEAMLLLRERAIESSTNGIVIVDMNLPDNPVIYVNQGFEQITGYTYGEVIGRNCRFLQGEATSQSAIKELSSAIRESRPTTVLLRNFRRDGSPFWNELTISPVFDDAGRCTHFVGVQNDITTRIRAEEELQVRTARLDAIFAVSPDGFVAFDASGSITDVNPAFLRMTGLETPALLGTREDDFDTLMASLCDPATPYPPLGTGEPAGESSVSRQILRLRRPGERILERSIRMDPGGSLEKVAYFRDITRESEVDRLKSEFLSTAAHELRTPMASIYGFSELLLRRSYGADKQREMIGTINRQASILINLINELLDLARIEARAGKDFKFSPQSPHTLIVETASALRGTTGNVQIQLDVPEELPELNIDVEKITLCLTNVLSNAVKYSPGGGEIVLDTLCQGREDSTRFAIRVRDRGIGMTPEQLARVFERFYRADPSGNIPGTGLGMSLVKEIMEFHGGTVELQSVAGEGTTVTLWFPVAEGEILRLAA
ncbi:MAG: CHASE domain-containing protein [Azonexus sp.]|nr:CHASE domain-containing protein [Betaproteobacteria bacterium]MBK8918548.1 CHASE domain-containing protein [Betaproteobacteria bacterium]MBP6037499.1 CHASE domain-containing protein [Azonexus sp.]MBP6908072.1 CHASE domain-containing protein [Azonexus sp.]